MKSIKLSLAIGALCLASAAQALPQPPICVHAALAHIPCVLGLTDDLHWRSKIMVSTPSLTMPWQGNTVATVAAQFPIVINWEFQTESAATLNAQIAQFSDISLARFSHEYWIDSHGDLSTLMYWATLKLTAPNLVRLYRVFGYTVSSSTALYAPAAVRAQYNALAKPAFIKQSHAAYVQAGKVSRTINAMATGIAAPTINMTPYEIYNEYLWTSAETELGAFAMTAKFMAKELQLAALIGWTAGSHFYHFGESVDPNFGYDLTTMYGDYNLDFGAIGGERTGHGTVGEITVIETDMWCSTDEPC